MATPSAFTSEIPPNRRAVAEAALSAAFPDDEITRLAVVSGGASGALTYRVDAARRSYLMRLETRGDALRNPVQYTCMRIAAEAGMAPPLRHVDADAGVVIMDFVNQVPLAAYPGGHEALLAALGRLMAQLQACAPFPGLYRYQDIGAAMFRRVREGSLFAPGLLDEAADGLARLLEAYPKQVRSVSSHNDPNPNNILFDGTRLWLVDWETAYLADDLVDVAIVCENLAATPAHEAIVLGAWHGGAIDRPLQARLTLMRTMTRLYYAGLILSGIPDGTRAPETSLDAMRPVELQAAVAGGQLALGTPAMMFELAKLLLAGFLTGLRAPETNEALSIARCG